MTTIKQRLNRQLHTLACLLLLVSWQVIAETSHPPALTQPSTQGERMAAMADPDPMIRIEAIEQGKVDEFDLLLKGLRDPDPGVRKAVLRKLLPKNKSKPAELLSGIRNSEPIRDALRQLARGDVSPENRAYAARVHDAGWSAAAELTWERALIDPDLETQWWATFAAAEIVQTSTLPNDGLAGQPLTSPDASQKQGREARLEKLRSEFSDLSYYSFGSHFGIDHLHLLSRNDSKLGREGFLALLQNATGDPDAVIRRWGVLGIAVANDIFDSLPGERSRILTQALADPDSLVRIAASLGQVPAGLRDELFRRIAADGPLEFKRVLPFIHEKKNGDEWSPLVGKRLLLALAADTDAATRFNAQWSLDDASIASLEEWITHPNDVPPYRGAAAWATNVLASKFPAAPETRTALRNAIASPDGRIRRSAFYSSAHNFPGDLDLVIAASDAARRDRSVQVRAAAVVALALSVQPEARKYLVELASDPTPTIRQHAIGAIAETGTANEAPFLVAALGDPSSAVRRAALQGLPRLNGNMAETVPRVTTMLGDKDASIRETAAHIIGLASVTFARGDYSQATAALLALQDDPSPAVRRSSVNALAALGGKTHEAIYVKALEDPSDDVRYLALITLAEHATEMSLAPLSRYLKDGVHSMLSYYAIRGLARIPGPEATRLLEAALDNDVLAHSAARALVDRDSKTSAPAILAAFLKRPESNAFFSELARSGEIGKYRKELLTLARDPQRRAYPGFLVDLFVAFPNEVSTLIPDHCDAPAAPATSLQRLNCLADLILRTTMLRLAGMNGEDESINPQLKLMLLSPPEERTAALEKILDTIERLHADPATAGKWRGAWVLGKLTRIRAENELDQLYPEFDRLDQGYLRASLQILALRESGGLFRRLATRVLSSTDSKELREIALGAWSIASPNDANESPEALLRMAGDEARAVARRFVEFYSPDSLIVLNSALSDGANPVERFKLLAGLIGERKARLERFDPARLHDDLKRARIDANKAEPEIAWLIAELLKERNAPEDALGWARTGLANWTPSSHPGLKVMLLWQQAEVLRNLGRLDEAGGILDEIEGRLLPQMLAGVRDLIPVQPHAYTRLLRGIVLADLRRPSESVAALYNAEQALRRETISSAPPVIWGIAGRLSHTKRLLAQIQSFRAAAQRDAASADARAALAYFAEQPAAGATLLAREAEERAVETRIRLAIADGQYEEAQRDVERLALRRQGQPELAIASQSASRRKALEELEQLRTAISRLSTAIERQSDRVAPGSAPPGGDTEGSRDLRRQRAQMQRQLKETFIDLKRRHPEIASLIGAEPTELRQLQSQLGDAEAIVQYLLLEDRGWAFVATGKKLEVVELTVGKTAVAKAVRHYRAALQASVAKAAGSAESLRDNVAGRWLAEKLFAPLLPLLANAGHLVVVPNGPLHSLPFAALPLPDGFVAERFVISQLPSVSTLSLATREITAPASLLAIGNATPIASEWTPLPGAEDELSLAQTHLSRVKTEIHTRDDALSRHLRQQSSDPGMIHLALHGEAGAIDRTRLVFSDGYMRLADIWGLALDRTALVVLSACESALGEQLPGDEVTSLANGFMFAGARGVVATQWKIPDSATRALFDHFYQLLAADYSPATALAVAQRKMIGAGYPAGSWAAFIAVGK